MSVYECSHICMHVCMYIYICAYRRRKGLPLASNVVPGLGLLWCCPVDADAVEPRGCRLPPMATKGQDI